MLVWSTGKFSLIFVTKKIARHVDLNVIATEGGVVEIQGTGESGPFSREQLSFLPMLRHGHKQVKTLFAVARDPSHLNFLGIFVTQSWLSLQAIYISSMNSA